MRDGAGVTLGTGGVGCTVSVVSSEGCTLGRVVFSVDGGTLGIVVVAVDSLVAGIVGNCWCKLCSVS